MTSTNTFKKIKAKLAEDTENYNSAFDTILPGDQEQADIMSAPVDAQDEHKADEKEKLTAKAIDKIKQTLDVSDELQAILSEIDKINKDTNENSWTVNKEENTAFLPSKNAQIFLQNYNICLSMNGKVEIFKSVHELHDFLRKHNLPTPKNIKLHEAGKIHGSLNSALAADYKDLVNSYADAKYNKKDYDLKTPGKLSKEIYKSEYKKGNLDHLISDTGFYMLDADSEISSIVPDKAAYEKDRRDFEKEVSKSDYYKQAKEIENKKKQDAAAQEKLQQEKQRERTENYFTQKSNDYDQEFKQYLDYLDNPYQHLITTQITDFLTGIKEELGTMQSTKDDFTKATQLKDILLKIYDKLAEVDALVGDGEKVSDIVNAKRNEKEIPQEECATTSASLGAPVQYQAGKDKELNEEEQLDEVKPRDIGFVGDFISDPTGKQILGYGKPEPGQARWIDVDQKINASRADRPWLKYVMDKQKLFPDNRHSPSTVTFDTKRDPHFFTNAKAFLNHSGAKNSELNGSLWDAFWQEYIDRNPNSKGYGRFITTPEDLEQNRLLRATATMMTKGKLAEIAKEFQEMGIGNLYGNLNPEDPDLLKKLRVMNLTPDDKVNEWIPALKQNYRELRRNAGKLTKHSTDTEYLERFLADHPELEKLFSYKAEEPTTPVEKPTIPSKLVNTAPQAKPDIKQTIQPTPAATPIQSLENSAELYDKYAKMYNSGEYMPLLVTMKISQEKSKYNQDNATKAMWNAFINSLRNAYEAGGKDAPDMDETSYASLLPQLLFDLDKQALYTKKADKPVKAVKSKPSITPTSTSNTVKRYTEKDVPNFSKTYKEYEKKYNVAKNQEDITKELATLKDQYTYNTDTKAEYNLVIDNLIDRAENSENTISKDTIADLHKLRFSDAETDMDEGTISSFGKHFLNLQKQNDLPLKEEDNPADFATGMPAADLQTGADLNVADTDTDATMDPNAMPDMGMDPNAPAPLPQFGDLNINAGGYSPDDMNAQQAPAAPMPDAPEYKIIDVLVNDQDIHDIKVKVKDKKTGEISVKPLSEIDA